MTYCCYLRGIKAVVLQYELLECIHTSLLKDHLHCISNWSHCAVWYFLSCRSLSTVAFVSQHHGMVMIPRL